jgi:hypothetical protein
MNIYGPFGELDLRSCCELDTLHIYYGNRTLEEIEPAVPKEWPLVVEGIPPIWELKEDGSRGRFGFYFEREYTRWFKIHDFAVMLMYALPNEKSKQRPEQGVLAGRMATFPFVGYVHDTYSRFGQNGLDPVGFAFGTSKV